MSVYTSGYTFVPPSRQITFTGIANFNAALLQKIINKTTNTTIYDESDPTLGFIAFAANTVYLLAGMSGMQSTDALEIEYADAATTSGGGSAPYVAALPMTVGQTYPAGRGLEINCTVAGNVSVLLSGGGTLIIPVNPGLSTMDNYAVISINANGTTATATYALLN